MTKSRQGPKYASDLYIHRPTSAHKVAAGLPLPLSRSV